MKRKTGQIGKRYWRVVLEDGQTTWIRAGADDNGMSVWCPAVFEKRKHAYSHGLDCSSPARVEPCAFVPWPKRRKRVRRPGMKKVGTSGRIGRKGEGDGLDR